MSSPPGPPQPQLPSPFADLAGTGDEELELQICSFASRIAAAMCLFLLAVAEYDRRESWRRWECRSMVHWLSWRCGISPALAGQYCRTGGALVGLPTVTAHFSTGELSYSQVRAICRVATPETESMLVELAQYSTAAQLEKVVSSYQRVKAAAEQIAHERDRRRTLTWGYDDDGSVTGMFRLPPEDAAVFIKAIEQRTITLESTGPAEDNHTRDPIGARQADALVDLAAQDLNRAAEQVSDPGDRYLVTIVTDAALLQPEEATIIDVETVDSHLPPDQTPTTDATTTTGRSVTDVADRRVAETGAVPTDEPTDARPRYSGVAWPTDNPRGPSQATPEGRPQICEVAGGPGLAPSTVQRLLCDQPYVTVTTDPAGNILDVGRRTRRINRGLRRALNHRDQHCRFPGCTATIVDAHHLDYWTHGGATRLSNLASLCRRHHRRQHQGGFSIQARPGDELVFSLPNGQRLTTTPPPVPAPPGGDLYPITAPDACTTQWDGTRLDEYALDTIVAGLLEAGGLVTDSEPYGHPTETGLKEQTDACRPRPSAGRDRKNPDG